MNKARHRSRLRLGRQPGTLVSWCSVVVAASFVVVSAAPGIGAEEPSPSPIELPEVLVVTPAQAEGPFYPVDLPGDRDADLTVVTGAAGPASGETLVVEGSLVTDAGTAVEGAVVEIWQTDHQGIYLHPLDPAVDDRDETFQGYGESTTDASGAWSFRTILPELYGGRPRHIHAKVKVAGETVLTTQIYFSGGDISQAGSVAPDGEAGGLVVEARRVADGDGGEVLLARHLLVIPSAPEG